MTMDVTASCVVTPPYSSLKDLVNFFDGTLSAPIAVEWEITMRCNLRCIHCCFAAGTPRSNELTQEESKRVIAEMAQLGVFSIGFTGGEPLTRSDFLDIAAFARDKGLKLALNTNGTLIGKKNARRITSLFSEIQVSLDGAKPETHDFIRAQRGAFERAVRGIRELKEAGANVVINTTLMKPNQQEVTDILALAVELKVDTYRAIPVRQLGRATENSLELSVNEFAEIYATLDRLRLRFKDKIYMQLSAVPSLLDRFLEDGFSCPAAIIKCCIGPDGSVKPCDAFDIFYGGNIREQSLKDIWLHSPAFQSFRQSILEIVSPECRLCAFGYRCRGGCKGLAFLYYGTLNRPDPLCAEIKMQQQEAVGA